MASAHTRNIWAKRHNNNIVRRIMRKTIEGILAVICIIAVCFALGACDKEESVKMESDLSVDTSSDIGLITTAITPDIPRILRKSFSMRKSRPLRISTDGFTQNQKTPITLQATASSCGKQKRKATTYAHSTTPITRKRCKAFSTIYGWDTRTRTRWRAVLQGNTPLALRITRGT